MEIILSELQIEAQIKLAENQALIDKAIKAMIKQYKEDKFRMDSDVELYTKQLEGLVEASKLNGISLGLYEERVKSLHKDILELYKK